MLSGLFEEDLVGGPLKGGVVEEGHLEITPGYGGVRSSTNGAVGCSRSLTAPAHDRWANHPHPTSHGISQHRGQLGAEAAEEEVVTTGHQGFGTQFAILTHRRIIVVAGGHEDEITAHRSPTPMRKVCATSPHPVGEASSANRRQLVQRDIELRWALAGIVAPAPLVEPAAPELAHDHRCLGPECT